MTPAALATVASSELGTCTNALAHTAESSFPRIIPARSRCSSLAAARPSTKLRAVRKEVGQRGSFALPRSRQEWRHQATADPAEPQTTLEKDEGVASEGEEELPSPEEAEEVAEQAEEGPKDVLAALKAAFESKNEATQAEVEALVRDLQTDRDSLASTLMTFQDELDKSKDRYLRLNADFDNFRKRSEREKLSLASMVRGEVVEALLPMVDSFERAKTSLKLETEGEERIDNSYQGIYKQFVEVMKGFGVAAVETVGKEFNPEVHEAIMREDSTEFPDGVVSLEFRKGFIIGERLVRPAMVKVSTGPGPAGDGGATQGPVIDGEEASEE